MHQWACEWLLVGFSFSLVFNFCAVHIKDRSNAQIHHNSLEYVFTCAQEKHVYHKLKLCEQMKMSKKWLPLFITRRASMELGICIKKNTGTTKWKIICLFLQMRLTNPLRQPAHCFANYLFFISRSFMQNIHFYSSAWSKYMDILSKRTFFLALVKQFMGIFIVTITGKYINYGNIFCLFLYCLYLLMCTNFNWSWKVHAYMSNIKF